MGNFCGTPTRGTFRILLPVAFVFAIVLLVSGVVQNFADTTATTLAGESDLPGGS